MDEAKVACDAARDALVAAIDAAYFAACDAADARAALDARAAAFEAIDAAYFAACDAADAAAAARDALDDARDAAYAAYDKELNKNNDK